MQKVNCKLIFYYANSTFIYRDIYINIDGFFLEKVKINLINKWDYAQLQTRHVTDFE